MKKLFLGLLCISIAIGLSSCDMLFLLGGDIGSSSSSSSSEDTNPNLLKGSIAAPKTLKSGTTYVVEDTVYISSTLTIEAGAVLKFKQNAELNVTENGEIHADGSPESNIIFTAYYDNTYGEVLGTGSVAAGYWSSVYIGDVTGSRFNYCKFIYGGYSDTGYSLTYGSLYIGKFSTPVKNCQFINGNGYGLVASAASGDSTILSNTFSNCYRPMKLNCADNINQTDANIFIDNKQNGIFIVSGGGFSDSSLSVAINWSVSNIPYVIDSDIRVEENNTLNIYNNVVVKFLANASLSFNENNLKVGNNVTFTSFKDDTVGGDANGDGSLTSPANGDWEGIYRYSSTDSYYVTNSVSPKIAYYDPSTGYSYSNYTFVAP